MSDGEKEDIKQKAKRVPEWESELWSYLSKGDGMHCPLYDHCRTREEFSNCIDDHGKEIGRLLEYRKLDIDRCNFMVAKNVGACKPLQLVERLASECLRKGNVYGPPLPTSFISRLVPPVSFEIHTVPLRASHGALWNLKDRWIIQLRREDTPAIKRCTIFHEVFHILAHSKTTPVFLQRGTTRGYFNEGLADYFAICILIPRRWVREKWAEVKDVDRMATIFNVPITTMWFRLRLLGLV